MLVDALNLLLKLADMYVYRSRGGLQDGCQECWYH